MSKKLKIYLSVLLTICICLGVAIPAFAYPQTSSEYLSSYNMHVLTNVISGVESYGQIYSDNRRYDAYAGKGENTPNEKTCTLGWAQNYGSEAMKLVSMIYAADTQTFKKLDTCNPSITSMLQENWVAIRWSPSASQKAVLIKLITTDVGKNCQDALFAELMEKYLKNAVAYGVPRTNVKALMMWCEIAHLGGGNSAKRIFNRCGGNYAMDNIMAALKRDQSDMSSNNQVGDKLFWSRHLCCQNWINKYADTKNEMSVAIDTTTENDNKVITNDVFVDAVRAVYEESHNGNYKYGDSHATPPTSDKIISCDRLIAKALWDLGFENQPVSNKTTSGITVGNIDKYLPSYGFVKSTNINDIGYGSVVVTGDNGNPKHTFVAITNIFDNVIVKFDMGRQSRIESSQPFFEHWDGSGFIACYNIPVGGIKVNANNLIKQGQTYLNKYFNAGINVDGDFGVGTKKAYVKAIQKVLNEDYGNSLDIDGSFGNLTYSALDKHKLGLNSTGRLVTLLEVGLLLNGYDPKGVEESGNFGNGLLDAVNKFKYDNKITVNNLAGAMTFKALAN